MQKKTSYDEIPYESLSFPQTHPDRLATLGRLFGLSPAPVTRCRVLELGCASGGNLIPMAYNLPESEFVGVDLSMRQVEMGRRMIQDIGIQNIRIENSSILDVNSSWGIFDYIICHGVYSWVNNEIQDKILAICNKNLMPQGVAYVSYNTYPGWHMREMIRHTMLYHANQFSDTRKRIEQARALIDFLARAVPTEGNPYGLLLQNELNLIRQCKDWYLFHDHLEEINSPIYFYKFIKRAKEHGLQYLAEANFSTMLSSGFSEDVAQTLDMISNNIIHKEQYMDFIRNRFFRRTLLCHTENALKRDLGAEDVSGLLIASDINPETETVDLSPEIKQSFRTPQGLTVESDFPLTKAVLTILNEHWPKALDQETLVLWANQRLGNSLSLNGADLTRSLKTLLGDMLKCYTIDAVEFHTWQADFITEISEQPKINKFAAYLASQNQPVVNQRHEIVNLDPVAKQMIRILDGTKDRTTILKFLCKLVEDGTLVVRQNNNILKNIKQIEDTLKETIEIVLTKLAKTAMLIG